ncbi:MAG: methyltransferase [Breznakibacter sp.]
MANTHFQFKQFKVEQSSAAMKVGTDGVLLGAWAPVNGCRYVLDVGTGTGLLALMIAQRDPLAIIDAIEIDANAAAQAKYNIINSPWPDRINIMHCSLQDFAKQKRPGYDLIVCNPPFFANSLKSPHAPRNLARHDVSLPLDELVKNAIRLLQQGGTIAIVLPPETFYVFEQLMRNLGFGTRQLLEIIPMQGKAPKRILAAFDRSGQDCLRDTLIVESTGRHGYSDEYKQLTKEFYLTF